MAAACLIAAPMPAFTAPCLADHPPDAQPANSQVVPPEFCISGGAGQHYYLWNIPASFDGKVWKLRLEALPGEDTRLVVQSLDHDPHQGAFHFQTLWQGANTAATSNVVSSALALKPGLYGIAVATRQAPGLYRLFVQSARASAAPAQAASAAPTPIASAMGTTPSSAEPASSASMATAAATPAVVTAQITDKNNSPANAFVLSPSAAASGVLSAKNRSRDSQFVTLTLDDSWKNKRFDLVLRAPGRSEDLDLVYVLPDGSDGELRSAKGEVRIPRMAFSPGKHVFRVSAVAESDLPYTLNVENAGDVAPGQEYEPNDGIVLAFVIPQDGTISGTFDGIDDADYLRFHVSGPPKLWRIDCDCAHATSLQVKGTDGGTLVDDSIYPGGHEQISSVLLPAGDHFFRITGSNGPYALHILPQAPAPLEAGGKPATLDAPLDKVDEIEPNDDPSTAMPIALDSSRGGLNDYHHDNDYYRFALLGPTHVRLTLVSPDTARHMYIFWGVDTIQRISMDAAAKTPAVWEGVLDAGDYYVDVFSDSPTAAPYRLKLQTADPFAQSASAQLNLSAHLVFDPHVAAHAADAQMVLGHLDVISKAGTPMDLSVVPYAADDRWHIATNTNRIHLDAGGKATLAVTVRVAPDALGDHPVEVALGLRDANGNHATASTVLVPEVAAPAVSPSPSSDVPARLVGGLNVAWSALGAKSLDGHPQLIDGLANYGSSVELGVDKAGTALGIALAGSGPVHLLGFALIPAPWESAGRRLRGFRILASTDGTHFTTVVSGRMSPRDDAQYFVLPKAIDARFLKLVPLDAQFSQSLSIALGDFQAIADPASAPLGKSGLEISSLLRGGHEVLSDPYPYYEQAMLSDGQKLSSGVGIPAGHTEPLFWVMAFLDDRPARIDRIDWRYSPNESGYSAIPSVDVYSSLISPDGPWTKLGTWRIAPSGDSTPFHPQGAPLVRYLRFVAAATKGGVMAAATKSGSQADLPQHLSVQEIPATGNYHSVLALAAQTDGVPAKAFSGSSTAQILPLGKPVEGAVRLDTRTDRWLLDLPAGTHNLTLTLGNQPAIGAVASMKSADGKTIALTEKTSDLEMRRYSAQVGAGRYEIDVSEPPRSIALLWDTSGSTSGWKPAIIAAVRSIAQDVSPGHDEVNLFPFHDPLARPLLKTYSGDPAVVFSALQNYDWKDSSSGAEGALIGAMQTLAHRPGRRGIIMLTDAETDSTNLTPQLWQAIAQTGAQIFTLQVSTNSDGEAAWASRNLMMDWASATGGFHTMLGDQSGAEAAFKRAAATLRGWAPYTLKVTVADAPPPPPVAPAAPTAPPPPGKLNVVFAPSPSVAPAAKEAPRDAVALVLDASGSMQATIHGKSKIGIARSELDHLVRDVIPEGTPITLRVYGQGGRGSCRSDLMIPLAPLDRAKAEAVVSRVRSTSGAKTATAASLHATVADLAAAQGQKRVILITDGEENCGGNVETEITLLKKSGFDVELDIVGFAIDAPRTGKTFARWAQLGGGKYFEASDASTLDTAVRAAITRRFDVLDSKGVVVASGDIGGDAVTLPAGHYAVQLHGQPKVSVDVDVKPVASVTATLPR